MGLDLRSVDEDGRKVVLQRLIRKEGEGRDD